MANYKGHIAGAVGCAAVAIVGVSLLPGNILSHTGGLLSQWQFVSALFVLAILFGLWPDVDTNSKGQDIFFGLAFSIDILLIWQGYLEAAAYLGLLAMTPIVGKHRGWTHSKIAMCIVPLPIVLVPYLYRGEISSVSVMLYAAAVVGYFSHLLLDGKIVGFFRVEG
jgi:membrane-bound metal-dependent hydrolase YbcI (DUF457 family)